MQTTDILMSEHRVIEKVLNALESAANRLEAGGDIPMDFFLKAADFIRNFADGTHHQKEEGILFTALEEHGLPKDADPVSVFMDEHVEGRRLTKGMVDCAERITAGDTSAKSKLVQHAQDYAALLREHIQKEDNVLFPMADNILAEEETKLLKDFNRADDERGTGEKYLKIAEELAGWGL
ncbi:MAG TPA: hemerythrin domain-containing protein [Anaerolineales bacterium]|nr:hemerythrin domain-containing protein [Anaerolineales bacterium]